MMNEAPVIDWEEANHLLVCVLMYRVSMIAYVRFSVWKSLYGPYLSCLVAEVLGHSAITG